jgi:peptidoglycan L-alanyl-D-glutamate endopeptidase CwlK
MSDKTSIARIATLHPAIRSEAASILIESEKAGVGIRITSALRTPAEQEALYAQGRTKPGRIVTNAKAWQSYHNYGLAVDICLLHKDGSVSWDRHEDLDADGLKDWDEVTKIFDKYGWEWAGRWKTFPENPHYQKTFGTWQELNEKKRAGKVDENGYILL